MDELLLHVGKTFTDPDGGPLPDKQTTSPIILLVD